MKRKPGIYIVVLLIETAIPVTKDVRYVDTCAKVNQGNIKVGKAKDFSKRKSDYGKDFGEENMLFEPLAKTDDFVNAERVVLRALKKYRKLSLKGGTLEWLEGIAYEDVIRIVFAALDEEGIKYVPATENHGASIPAIRA